MSPKKYREKLKFVFEDDGYTARITIDNQNVEQSDYDADLTAYSRNYQIKNAYTRASQPASFAAPLESDLNHIAPK